MPGMRAYLLAITLLASALTRAGLVSTPVATNSWHTDELVTCFETLAFVPDAALPWTTTQFKAEIQATLVTQLGRAGLRVSGGRECGPADGHSLHIHVMNADWDTGAYTRILGAGSRGLYGAVNVNFLEATNPESYPRSTALHEVMHALGFNHEHERPNHSDCQDNVSLYGELPPKVVALGDYDPRSIMNYCIYNYVKPPETLAEGLETDKTLAQLTTEDVVALRAYLRSPIAHLQEPIPHQVANHTQTVHVAGVESYRYAIGKPSLDCKSMKVYSAARSVETALTLDLPKVGKYKLCLLGARGSERQPVEVYSSYEFTRVASAVSIVTSLEQIPYHQSTRIQLAGQTAGSQFKLVPREKIASCNDEQNYKPTGGDSFELALSEQIRIDFSGEDMQTDQVLCVKQAGSNSVSFESFNIFEDGIELRGLPRELQVGQKVRAIPDSSDHYYTHYRTAFTREGQSCQSPELIYGAESPIDSEVSFVYDPSSTTGVCILARDQRGRWIDRSNVRLQEFNTGKSSSQLHSFD